jgi:hypothetical protein
MRLAVATGCTGLLFAFACTSGGAGSTAGGSFAQQYCGLIQPCCADAGLAGPQTLCTSFAQAAASTNPGSAQACLDGMQQAASSSAFCTTLGGDVQACNQLFGPATAGGTVAPGQPCTGEGQCAPAPGGGATCFSADVLVDGGTTQTQTCMQTTPGKAGDSPCVGVVESGVTVYSWSGSGAPPTQGYLCSLADGLTCSDATQQCTALANPGDPCTVTTDCVTTAYCVTSTTSGACTPRLADGAACDSAPEGCLTTSYCEPSTHTCTPYVAPGSACTADPQCQFGCVNQACAQGTSNIGLAVLCD